MGSGIAYDGDDPDQQLAQFLRAPSNLVSIEDIDALYPPCINNSI